MSRGEEKAKRRRIWTYSLRTLLLLLTIACVWLSLQVNRAQRQRAVVKRILQLGGEVKYAHEIDESLAIVPQPRDPGPDWLRRLVGDEYFVTLAGAQFNGRRGAVVGDADLEQLTRVTTYRRIAVYNTQVSDAGLVSLKHLKDLECLGLDGSLVTDKGMAHVRELTRLRQLYLAGLPIRDDGLAQLTSLKQLRKLHINGTQVTDEGLRHLADLPELRVLQLGGTQITDAGIVHLERLTGLETLDIYDTRVSKAGWANLRKALPNCSITAGPFPGVSPGPHVGTAMPPF